MIEAIIRFSVQQKLIIMLLVLGLIGGGIFALRTLPIDAVPDITNNQVQIVTVSAALAPQEVEQFITYPVEVVMANIPDVLEIRSISRYGLSVVTVVFKDHVPILEARQFVKEQISLAQEEIPAELGRPELMPITTGLGEIYQYVLEVAPGFEDRYGPMELRTIQDWIVKRQLAGISGIIEVSSFGGYLKQYEVAIDPVLLQGYSISIAEVFEALARNNQNSGGAYIEKATNAYYIRTEGIVQSLEDIKQIVVANPGGVPVMVGDLAKVQFGSPKRFGAMTMDGKGEAVGGITLMLKGANSSEAIANVQERVEMVRKSLPEGVLLYPYLDRSRLVNKTIDTVKHNLLEGGLIVIVVLILLLGDFRSGLIVASVIPLAMLFALIMMRLFNVSANLMSLGAIDFGIVVDGAVIIVEGVVFALSARYAGRRLKQEEMDKVIVSASSSLFRAAVFGVFIILVVFIPIMTLTGIEGKMFRPMAMTFSFAVLGALLLSLTYVPMLSALLLSKRISHKPNLSERFIDWLKNGYLPVLKTALRVPYLTLGLATVVLVSAVWVFSGLGAEFIPTLEEGDLAMQMTIAPGSSLEESVRASGKAESILLRNFPEVKHVISKIGTAEVPTDPMAIEDADIMIILEEKEEWVSATNREDLVAMMKEKLSVVAGASFEFTQPIQLRFNELMTGAKTDIAVQIFGEDMEELGQLARKAAGIIEKLPGAGDVKVEQTEGLPQLRVKFNRTKIAEYGLDIERLNTLVRTAYAGEVAGVVFENERKFDLVVRLAAPFRQSLDLDQLYVYLDNGNYLPLSEVASLDYTEGPMQISREDARRRITIGVNVRNRDMASLVEEIQQTLEEECKLPPGYMFKYGGQFENLEQARQRLSIAVPVALLLIFFLLFFTFGKLKYALMIFTAVPLSAIGGIFALWLRGMPFSISAGVGFIALFGVAVLNGIVLISYFNRLVEEGLKDIQEVVMKGAAARLRPVLMTATVAALGFLPMALSTSNGAEVQKPLATVVIGGLITATLLTLLALPVMYYLVSRKSFSKPKSTATLTILIFMVTLGGGSGLSAQSLSLEAAIDSALIRHPELRSAATQIQIEQLGESAARQIPGANFSMNLGQINTEVLDFNFSAVQSLGNIPADKQRRKVAAARTVQAERQARLIEHQIITAVKQHWYEWKYQSERLRQVRQLEQQYQELLSKADLRLQQGAVNRLEHTLLLNQVTRIRQRIIQLESAVTNAANALQKAAWLEQPIEADTQFAVIQLPVLQPAAGGLVATLEQEVEVSRAERVLSEKALSPEWNFHFFHQSIRPDYPLFGGGVGVQVPLFRKAQNSTIQQKQLQQLIAENKLETAANYLEKDHQTAWELVQYQYDLLNTNGQELLTQANQLRSLALQQFEAGQTDYFRLLQSLEAALDSELSYLEIVNNYHQAVLTYQYYTQMN